MFDIYGRVALSGHPEQFEYFLEALQEWFWISVYSPAKGCFVAVFDVITERKQAEVALKQARDELQWFFDLVPDMVCIASTDGYFKNINKAWESVLGFTTAELLGEPFIHFIHPDDIASTMQEVEKQLAGKATENFTNRYRCKDGTYRWLEWAATPAKDKLLYAAARDITERKRTEEILQVSEKRLHEIVNHNADGIIVVDEAGDILFLNPAAAAMLGSPAEKLLGQPLGLPIITGESCEIDLVRPGSSGLPAEMRMMRMQWEGKPAFVVSLHDTSERRQAEAAQERSNQEIRRSLIGTIDAVARVVEARDPYTSGHQRRVAELATAIAGELGWDEQRIEGLRLGTLIHDIGKIQIPAELLAKPSRLTEIEYEMIKTHAEIGYGILKGITFPWPVADIARQHHERLDGSGYPQGLQGEEICEEARIVAVADVVEAIASHRPYRPGLGIEAALAEIESHKGTYYDATFTDICLKLFRENEFSFSTA